MSGRDITEGRAERAIAVDVGIVSTSTYWQNTSESYDVAVGGQPFFYAINDQRPYIRQTAPYRKEQFDNQTEPGEQSLTGWWIRSQMSFHSGSGIKFYDPATTDETGHYRFSDSKGVNVWTKGQVTLLKSCTEGHITTGPIASNGAPQQHMRSIKWSTFTGALLHDYYDVDKIKVTDPSNPVHFIDYNAGAGVYPVYAICDDGTNAYWVTNKTSGGTTKFTVYGKPLTGDSSSTADEFKVFDNSQIVSHAIIDYVKSRLVICADNKVYECSTAASSTPTLLYTNPASSFVYTSIAASGPAIYIAGYNGTQSTIERYVLSTSGVMPTLTSAVIAAELPVGEIVHKIHYYLGYLAIGTNKGIRIAEVKDDGSINYGPLIVETTTPVYDFAARDKFIWATASIGNSPGTIRINLGEEIETLRFAYANDIYAINTTNGSVATSAAFIGNTSRLAFCSNALSAATADRGGIYFESATDYISSGYLQTGYIRYATIEDKVFKTLHVNMENANGSLTVQSISKAGNEYTIANFGAGDLIEPFAVAFPLGTQEYVSFKFNFTPKTSTVTPTFSAYQLKALPAIARQRFIQYPVLCYDIEADKFGNQKGYEGYAFYRINQLEELESTGDTIRVQDFRNGETYLGVIEELTFINRTPSSARFSGFGGVFLVTIRTVS